MKTLLQHVMGCRLNHAEAESVRAAFRRAGWRVATGAAGEDGAAAPDAFHLHTCAVTAQAQREAVRRVRAAARAGIPEIVVSGCVANLPDAAGQLRAAGATALVSRFGRDRAADGAAPDAADIARAALSPDAAVRPAAPGTPRATRTPVKIQDGCDARCAYCIVPDARGAPRSLPLPGVLAAVRAAVADGPREIVLTGVNTARWRDGAMSLPDAARAAAGVPGVLRVRLASVEPDSIVPAIAAAMAESGGKICRTLHLPLQSGSDRILRAMRRHYTAAQFRETARKALSLVPSLGLGTDVIAGFPGETDEDFARTEALIEELPFSNVHVFPYSERPGTPAATMPGAVPPAERRRRARHLMQLAERKRAEFAAGFAGAEVEVLAETPDASAGGVSGWTGEYLRATVRGCPAEWTGALIRAKTVSVTGDALLCDPVSRSGAV